MNRYTKQTVKDWVRDGKVNINIVSGMLKYGYLKSNNYSVLSMIKHAARRGSELANIVTKYNAQYTDSLFTTGLIPTGKISIDEMDVSFFFELKKTTKSSAIFLLEQKRMTAIAYNRFLLMKEITDFESSRKMYLNNVSRQDQHVYIISDINNPGRVKIGISKNIGVRIEQLDREFNTKFFILAVLVNAGFSTEQRLHQKFSQFHIEREFFTLSDPIKRLIEITNQSLGYPVDESIIFEES